MPGLPRPFGYTTTFSLHPQLVDQGRSLPQPRTHNPYQVSHAYGLAIIRFRSPLLTEYLFLRVLRCFTSPRSLRHPMNSDDGDSPCRLPGFPIRTPSDQRSFANSPRLIAGHHVLHRLLMPRHPPCAHKHFTTTKQHTENKDARVHCTVLKQHTDHHQTRTHTRARPAAAAPGKPPTRHLQPPRHNPEKPHGNEPGLFSQDPTVRHTHMMMFHPQEHTAGHPTHTGRNHDRPRHPPHPPTQGGMTGA